MKAMAPMSNFHLPLPRELYENLKAEAKREKRPTTSVARRAIEVWLRRARRNALHKDIASYARRNAGSSADLDKGLESAAIESLTASDE